MENTDKKTRIVRDLQGDILNPNHVSRRFFRCWLDGSYLGEDHYRANRKYLLSCLAENGLGIKLEIAIRGWVISEFCKYTAHDADCSPSYAQKVIVRYIRRKSHSNLFDMFTKALIRDALYLIDDEMKEYSKEMDLIEAKLRKSLKERESA